MKFSTIAAASLLAFASVPAVAQDAGVATGATVYGPDGAEVGTVLEVTESYAVVDTGTNRASLALDSFGEGTTGPVIGFTKAELDAAVSEAADQAGAALTEALVAGATVHDSEGVVVGTVKEISAEGNVVIERETGPVSLATNQFALGEDGKLQLHFTIAQLEAAIAGQQGV